jgi:hypothetical protein
MTWQRKELIQKIGDGDAKFSDYIVDPDEFVRLASLALATIKVCATRTCGDRCPDILHGCFLFFSFQANRSPDAVVKVVIP